LQKILLFDSLDRSAPNYKSMTAELKNEFIAKAREASETTFN
jgi:hypothetical protein